MNKLIVYFVFALLFIVGFASAHGEGELDYDGHHSMMSGFYGPYGMWGMGFFGWVFMLLIIVVLVLFIVWLVRQLQDSRGKRR